MECDVLVGRCGARQEIGSVECLLLVSECRGALGIRGRGTGMSRGRTLPMRPSLTCSGWRSRRSATCSPLCCVRAGADGVRSAVRAQLFGAEPSSSPASSPSSSLSSTAPSSPSPSAHGGSSPEAEGQDQGPVAAAATAEAATTATAAAGTAGGGASGAATTSAGGRAGGASTHPAQPLAQGLAEPCPLRYSGSAGWQWRLPLSRLPGALSMLAFASASAPRREAHHDSSHLPPHSMHMSHAPAGWLACVARAGGPAWWDAATGGDTWSEYYGKGMRCGWFDAGQGLASGEREITFYVFARRCVLVRGGGAGGSAEAFSVMLCELRPWRQSPACHLQPEISVLAPGPEKTWAVQSHCMTHDSLRILAKHPPPQCP